MTNRFLPFRFNRKDTENKRHYEILCIKYCSPAKIIKEYLKCIFECVYSELEKNKIQRMFYLRRIEFFLEDYDCIFNPITYSEVLNLYLVYLSLYKKKGFTKDYLEQVILRDTNYGIHLKPKFNFFDSRDERWRKRIKLSSENIDIILLREIPFFIEDYFKEIKNPLSQKIIYMFSFFYLYFLVDYEFMLSNIESISGQEGLFKETKILRSFFRYIFLRSNKNHLEKYLRNDEVVKVLKDNLTIDSIEFIDGIYIDFRDKLVLKRLFKKYNIDNIDNNDFEKLEEMELFEFVSYVVEEKFREIDENEEDLVDNIIDNIIENIIDDFKEIKEKEQIIYLTFAKKKYLPSFLPIFGTFSSFFDVEEYDIFSCFEKQKISRMIDPYNRLKRRRFQDIKHSKLYLTFCKDGKN